MLKRLPKLIGNIRQLQRLIVALAFVLALITLLSFAWQMRNDYQRALDEHRNRLEALSIALAADAESALRASASVLRGVELAINDNGGLAAWDEKKLHALFGKYLSLNLDQQGRPPINAMWAANASGEIVASSVEFPGKPVKVADREYFLHHQSTASHRSYLSPLSQSRVTGLWTIFQTIRLEDGQGNFAGTLGISLRVDYFERLYPRLRMGDDSGIALLRTDGKLLYRFPFDPAYARIDANDHPRFQALLKQQQGSGRLEDSPFDHRDRILGFKVAEQFPLVAVVSLPTRTALERWRHNALIYASLGLIAYLVVLMLCLFSLRQLRYLEKATEDSLYDALTELPNRRYFEQHCADEWRRARREQQAFSLLYIDIDHFKHYNDRYGHDAGDSCLRRVAQAMQGELCRVGDMLARYGGEEFVCVLPGTDLAGARRMAVTLIAVVQDLALPHAGSPTAATVTISIGLASTLAACDGGCDELLRAADAALYVAKNAGRNRCVEAPCAPAAKTGKPG